MAERASGFVSPAEQRERIEAVCARDGLVLLAVHEELDVSGGKSLAMRPGLRLTLIPAALL